ncbi:MAG: terminase [Parasporobacterium sp.]|nr:terminase [Parasporobacterium sp.]
MKQRIGSQKPTVRIALPYSRTDGKDAIDLYELTGQTVMEWQKLIIRDILARNRDGLWAHTRYGYEVPRQNGKGEILAIRELYGLAIGERILHTAHLVQTAHKAFERLEGLLDKLGIEYRSIKAKGQELIEITDGGRVEFRTRTAKGGLGESYDLVIIDEAQEYQTDHETALLYVIAASRNPQIIMTGTPPTPISSGTVFRDYREEVLKGGKKDSGWAEWSVEEMSDIQDRDLWYRTNPSLGIRLTERTVEAELGETDAKKIDFNIQRLGLWIRENQQSAILQSDWDRTLVHRIPELTGKIYVGIKYAKTGDSISVAVAVKTKDGRIFTEVVKRIMVRDGIDWILSFLEKIKKKTNKVVIDGANGQKILADAMKEHKLKGCVLPKVADVINANATFEKLIFEGKLCRMEQPSLTRVVTNCSKRQIGSNGGFGYQAIYADMDVSLMDSVIFATWAAQQFPDPKPQKISY